MSKKITKLRKPKKKNIHLSVCALLDSPGRALVLLASVLRNNVGLPHLRERDGVRLQLLHG